MIINPDNPTGMVYTENTLREIVAVAREHNLFIIADEVYTNIVYNGETAVPISDVIGDVPAISLKGISKEFPWPGSRCGWIEVYNGHEDEQFHKYVNLILTGKMNEVCSTTLPQTVIPAIMQHPGYAGYLAERIASYEKMSNITYDFLKEVPQLMVNRTNGAFYMAVAFQGGLADQPPVDPHCQQRGARPGERTGRPARRVPGQAVRLPHPCSDRYLRRAALLVLHAVAGLPGNTLGEG